MQMGKAKRAALYVRVSTDHQSVENQIRELRQVAERRGWTIVEVYRDAGVSGAKGRDQQPGLDGMLKDASGASSMWSMFCWSRYKSTPTASRCLIVSSRSISDRPSRSMAHAIHHHASRQALVPDHGCFRRVRAFHDPPEDPSWAQRHQR